MDNNKFCQCKSIGNITSGSDSWYEYDVCCNCGKIIEDSFRELNHYDGEDHVVYPEY